MNETITVSTIGGPLREMEIPNDSALDDFSVTFGGITYRYTVVYGLLYKQLQDDSGHYVYACVECY